MSAANLPLPARLNPMPQTLCCAVVVYTKKKKSSFANVTLGRKTPHSMRANSYTYRSDSKPGGGQPSRRIDLATDLAPDSKGVSIRFVGELCRRKSSHLNSCSPHCCLASTTPSHCDVTSAPIPTSALSDCVTITRNGRVRPNRGGRGNAACSRAPYQRDMIGLGIAIIRTIGIGMLRASVFGWWVRCVTQT